MGFTERMLIELARDHRSNAHAPYSKFTVGSACLASSGETYVGTNVENASYPVGCCAERIAIGAAVAHGETKIKAIAIAGNVRDEAPDPDLRPCGMCLQFMSEFMGSDGKIFIADGVSDHIEFSLGELLPQAFNLDR